ncbi:MAG: slipin family protein [Bdellovibrionales bacterium]|jgi:regulator of protease activity HflC (stomatin/prohibitin superfamily)|nr:slipin family protein [Bdellovibrionales bacterium]MBT3526938.1 slipin family protein [Bdellovibrionales bacterium]MBT7670101.1 slipin family protein [Bdellovibrionales bacterium]MBT7767472.1 slipin family protein [Bdellovibrionales bacterium]
MFLSVLPFPFIIIILVLLFSMIKILNEYERGVVFRLGRFTGVRGPGLIILIPGLEKMRRVDLRTVTMDIPSQDIITRDNVTLKVNGVVYFRVNNPELSIVAVEDFLLATGQISQTTLRSVIGQFELDEILSQRDEINAKLQTILDDQTEPWGVKVSAVEVKAIDLPIEMQRAMAKQAEAERDKRAKVISAEGELEASIKLAEAAEILGKQKNAIVLRYLDTMKEISSGDNKSTTFFPLPVDFLNKLDSSSR